MPTYIVADDVLTFLGIEQHVDDPAFRWNQLVSWVNARINECESQLEDICKTAWVPKTRTDVIQNAQRFIWRGRLCHLVYTLYKPIISVSEIQVNVFGSWKNVDVSQCEIINNLGAVYVPFVGFVSPTHQIKITYTYGFTTLPNDVRGALIRMVAKELVNTQQIQIFLPTPLNLKDAIEKWDEYINNTISRWSFPQIVSI
jgi:hypothetical protein